VVIVEILKNIYGNSRPFWIDTSLFKVCEGGWGNPSGHSISSAAGFLGLWSTIFDVEYFDNKPFWKFSALCAFVAVIFLILFSRLFLAAHSLNQVIYGASLGLSIYLFLYVIFKVHRSSSKNFFFLFTKKTNKIAFSVLFAFLITVMLLVYYLKNNDYSVYEEIFKTICTSTAEYKRFNNSGIYGGSVVFVLIGAYYGTMLMLHLLCKKYQITPEDLEEEEFSMFKTNMKTLYTFDAVNNWNKTTWIHWLIIVLIMVACCIPVILKLIISDRASLIVIIVFKICLPYLFIGFGIYGLTVYFSIYFNFANRAIIEAGETTINTSKNYKDNDNSFDNMEFRQVEVPYNV